MDEVTAESSRSGIRPCFSNWHLTLPVIAHDLALDGHLPSHARASFAKEFIKYLLYVRNQIPDSVEMIQKKERDHVPNSRRPCLVQRRRANFLSQIEAVFSFIDHSFSLPESPLQLALVFGSTLVSPKESYLVTFPSIGEGESFVSKVDSALRKLLCKIVGGDLIGQLQGHSKLSSVVPSSLRVAIKAKRSSQFENSDLCRPLLNGLGHLHRRVVVSVSVINSRKNSDNRGEKSPSAAPFVPFRDDDVSVEEETSNLQKLSIENDAENVRIDKGNEGNDEKTLSPQSLFDGERDSIWYICTHAVKGLKPRQI